MPTSLLQATCSTTFGAETPDERLVSRWLLSQVGDRRSAAGALSGTIGLRGRTGEIC